MNRYKILYAIIFCMAFSSCGNWLTLNPEEQIKESELYSKAAGFHTQINGIYKVLSKKELYGRELSYGFIEALAQVYESNETGNDGYRYAMTYDYDKLTTKKYTDSFWPEFYNAIANCNSVIHYAKDANPEIFYFKEKERKCVLGEAYALRAMIHFDILRLYAPAPRISRTDKIIPYVKDFPTHVPMNSSTDDILKNVIADLEMAQELTMEIDHLSDGVKKVSQRLEFLDTENVNRFTSFRGYRLNHYAIKALLARVHMYNDDEVNALKYANELIKLNEDDWFSYGGASQIYEENNIKLYGDVIFALFDNKLTDYYDQENYEGSKLISNYAANTFDYDSDDYRYKYQYTQTNGYDFPIKYAKVSGGRAADYSNKLIPMLRMSEMYYIAAECLFDTDRKKAKSYLEFVRNKRRSESNAYEFPDVIDKNEFILNILSEIKREQFGEGQLFFYNKRFDNSLTNSNWESVKPVYVLPIPDDNV